MVLFEGASARAASGELSAAGLLASFTSGENGTLECPTNRKLLVYLLSSLQRDAPSFRVGFQKQGEISKVGRNFNFRAKFQFQGGIST